MNVNTLYNIDCREGLSRLEDESIDCVIGSPPYWNLRDYNVEGSIWDGDPECKHEFDQERIRKLDLQAGNLEFKRNWRELASNDKSSNGQFCLKCGEWKGCLGLEPDFNLYVKHLCDIYDLVKQKLKKTGTCWVNLGDTYAGGGRSGSKKYFEKGHKQFGKNDPQGKYQAPLKVDGYKSKCLCMIPQRFAIEMINRGWILRNVIVWHKNNCMPSSARDRFTVDFEYVYFFVKNRKYWFDQDAVREPLQESTVNRDKYTRITRGKDGKYSVAHDHETPSNPKGRNKRCVWTINTKPNKEAHFATFNPDLVRPMILSGCPKDGLVCDPFAGTGTTLLEAWKQGRNYIGFEISKEYCEIANKYLDKETKYVRMDHFIDQKKV